MNPSIAAVTEEIQIREKELEALRNALAVLQSDRQPAVHIVAGQHGQFAISNIFTPPNGHGTVEITSVQDEPPTIARNDENPRARTARLLALFDRRSARSLEDVATEAGLATRNIAIGILMKHGYLKAKGQGYVRTAKAYVP